MTWRGGRAEATLIAIFCISWLVADRSGGGEPPFRLSKEHDSVFREESYTSTSYFHFSKDGKYRQINREHMFTCESDRGTWTQDGAGQIELNSAILLKDVKKGPLRIAVRDVEKLDALRPLQKDIVKFLSAKRDFYARNEIERAWQYTYRWSLFESKITFFAVEVDPGVEKVAREQVDELLKAWTEYPRRKAKNRFRLLPVKYHKYVLLASDDYPFMANAGSPEEVRKVADLFGGPKGAPGMVYVLTDSPAVLKEMETTHPFLFHPELNQDRGQKLLRYK